MLFCKPGQKIIEVAGMLLRSMDVKKDYPVVAGWRVAEEPMQAMARLRNQLLDTEQHIFIAEADGVRLCQIALYRAATGELGKHIATGYHDCHVHLFLPPGAGSELYLNCLRGFMAFFFFFKEASLLYASAGIYENNDCRLLEQAGFIFQQNTMLTYQAVSLYLMTKRRYLQQ